MPLGRSFARRVVVGLAAVALSGCGLGALPSSYNGQVTGSIATSNVQTIAAESTGIPEVHSTHCAGLELERQARLLRIEGLQASVKAELANAPTTVAHAVLRAVGTPEEGTVAHKQIMEERAYLSSIAAAGTKLGCPPVVVAVAP